VGYDAPRASRSDRRRIRTRAALIDAARRVFAERGIAAATIQEIADTADVAKGSFYNHFDSREDILRAVAAATLDALGQRLDRDVREQETDPARVIARSLLSTLRICSEDPTLGGFVLRSAELLDLAESALGSRARRDLTAGRTSGRFRFDDLETVITAIAGASLALLRGRLNGDLEPDAEPRLVGLALRMLGVAPEEADALVEEARTALDATRAA